jgi:hypothetical protein
MESALMISPPSLSASRMPTVVLPIPVGPQMTMTFGFVVGETICLIKLQKGVYKYLWAIDCL